MKIFERLTDLLATPGVTRWNIFSYAFLVPALFGMLLEDWFGYEEGVSNPVTLAFVSLFFFSQALVRMFDRNNLLSTGESRSQKWWTIFLFLVVAAGLAYRVASQVF
ncbi:MAG: hypothetical protein KIS85_08225 [Anaerolineales bacterium]|nr:hypothetical protein [Anaerolineales bacterium]